MPVVPSRNYLFSTEALTLAPPWLQVGGDGSPGTGGRYQFLQGIALDFLAEKINQGALASFPGLTLTTTSLPLIGADRGLLQGPLEPNADYIARLLVWRQTWSFAGNAWSILKAARAYLDGQAAYVPDCRMVSNSSVWDWYVIGESDTLPPHHYNSSGGTANWNWDGQARFSLAGKDWDALAPGAEPWWRAWLIIYSETPALWVTQWPTLGTAGQPTLGNAPGASLGFANQPQAFFLTLLDDVYPFVDGNCWLRWLLICFDRTKLNPDLPASGGVNPDGTYGLGFVITAGVYTATWPSWLAPVPAQPPTVGGGSANTRGCPFGFAIQQGQYVPSPNATLPVGYNFNGSANNVTNPIGFSFSIVNGIYSD